MPVLLSDPAKGVMIQGRVIRQGGVPSYALVIANSSQGPLDGLMLQTNRSSFGLGPVNVVLQVGVWEGWGVGDRTQGGAFSHLPQTHSLFLSLPNDLPPLSPPQVPTIAPGSSARVLVPLTYDPAKIIPGAASPKLEVSGFNRRSNT